VPVLVLSVLPHGGVDQFTAKRKRIKRFTEGAEDKQCFFKDNTLLLIYCLSNMSIAAIFTLVMLLLPYYFHLYFYPLVLPMTLARRKESAR